METKKDTYLTISTPSSGAFKDKGSKFLAFAYPVKSEQEIKLIVSNLKDKYFDARHHCYAYRLGADKLAFRANDDGEPSGTAGKPILGQILSADLTNILIVVVRYFGGTLLGTSGLITAYRTASAAAISDAVIIQKFVYAVYELHFPYQQMNLVMKTVKDFDLETFDQCFELSCCMKVKIKLGSIDIIASRFASIENIKIVDAGIHS